MATVVHNLLAIAASVSVCVRECVSVSVPVCGCVCVVVGEAGDEEGETRKNRIAPGRGPIVRPVAGLNNPPLAFFFSLTFSVLIRAEL